jgi:hypothetical protein
MTDRLDEIEARVARLRSGPSSLIEAQKFMEWAPGDIEWLVSEVRELTKRVRMYEVVKS